MMGWDGPTATTESVRSPLPLSGTVIAAQANYYWVQLTGWVQAGGTTLPLTSSCPHDHLLCTRRSRLKKIGQQVMVGDHVHVEEPDWAGQRGAITAVLPRVSVLDRPPIANADQVLLLFALADPPIEPLQLSRFLIKAESTGLTVQVGLNKCDLVPPSVQAAWCDRLRTWGYDPLLLSAHHGVGLTAIATLLQQRLTILAGPSGVGKSSFINALIPAVEQRVGAVSGKLRRGRHTTRHVELFPVPHGGLIADTPGFNQPDLTCGPRELAHYFPEIRDRLALTPCQFSDCSHHHEPDCQVRGPWERYAHYTTFLTEAIAYQQGLAQRADTEATIKHKVSQSGKTQAEPKLSPKKYRQPSRRTQKQALADWDRDREE